MVSYQDYTVPVQKSRRQIISTECTFFCHHLTLDQLAYESEILPLEFLLEMKSVLFSMYKTQFSWNQNAILYSNSIY